MVSRTDVLLSVTLDYLLIRGYAMTVKPTNLTEYRRSKLVEPKSSSEKEKDTPDEYAPDTHNISFVHELDEEAVLKCDLCGNDRFHMTRDVTGTTVECTKCDGVSYLEDE
jgi:hypothetical protein